MAIPTGGFADTSPAGEPVPAGKYEVEVVKATEQEVKGEDSKHHGEMYLRLELRPLEDNLSDERFFTNLNFWAESKRFLMRDLLALGYSEADLRSPDFELEPEDLVGRKATAVVGIRKWEGEDRNDVKSLQPVGETGLPS